MILSGKPDRKSIPSWVIPSFLTVALLIILAAAGFEKGYVKEVRPRQQISCNAETVEGDYFIEKGDQFLGAGTQSDAKAKSGDYCSKTTIESREGMAFLLKNPKPGNIYKASVWRYMKNGAEGYLSIKSSDANELNIEINEHREYDENWWFYLEKIFVVPKNVNEIKISTLNKSDEDVYFDDLTIELLDTSHIDDDNSSLFNQKLDILLEGEAQSQLDKIRLRAQKEGVFIKREGSEVKAAIITPEENQKIAIRYKGDWLDHILGDQPSFRITCQTESPWNGMQTFSIQHPKTRGYLREWVYHDFLSYVDLLSPRYEFIRVAINEREKVYAVEEHFTKYLVERQKRREGPIIKLAENYFWDGMATHWRESGELAPDAIKDRAFWNSKIEPFKLKRTQKDSVLYRQFEIAQNLLHQYKYDLAPVDQIFDLDKLARFMAISELCLAHHSLTWHNQRFYYNPVIGLLEPIGFDASVFGDDAKAFETKLFFDKIYFETSTSTEPINRIFYDEKFLALYFHYLSTYADEQFIEKYIAIIQSKINRRQTLIQSVEPNYEYRVDELRDRARKIRVTLALTSDALVVYRLAEDNDSVTIELRNTHSLPLEISWGVENRTRAVVIPGAIGQLPDYTKLTLPKSTDKIAYRLPGVGSWQTAAIWPWRSPINATPRGELISKSMEWDTTVFNMSEGQISFRAGSHEIDDIIVIPSDKILRILPGTLLIFKKNAMLICLGGIRALGTKNTPIRITGNGNNGSVTVFPSKKSSELHHVIFNNQNTMKYKGWNLTGAVTFYETDVKISNCKFLNNNCEDALNIIRSSFEIKNTEFVNTFSDAFDADFCEGSIAHSSFIEIGNDAIDFSTSLVDIWNCSMKNIGDKAISAGEQATVTAHEVEVVGAVTGFASKDKSSLKLYNVSLTDCQTGFTAYQKKPEFGPATIEVTAYKEEAVKRLFLIEERSTLVNHGHVN